MAKSNLNIVAVGILGALAWNSFRKSKAVTGIGRVKGVVGNARSREFYDIQKEFERIYRHMRLDMEESRLWKLRHYYQDGETNKLFLAFYDGYMTGRLTYMHGNPGYPPL